MRDIVVIRVDDMGFLLDLYRAFHPFTFFSLWYYWVFFFKENFSNEDSKSSFTYRLIPRYKHEATPHALYSPHKNLHDHMSWIVRGFEHESIIYPSNLPHVLPTQHNPIEPPCYCLFIYYNHELFCQMMFHEYLSYI